MHVEKKKSARVVLLNTGRGLLLDAELIRGILQRGGWDVKLAARRPRKRFEKDLILWWETFKVSLPSRLTKLLDELQMGLGAVRRQVDLQIHLEDLSLGYIRSGSTNWLIPNQEWVSRHNLRHLPRLNRILCKTHEARTIFERYHTDVSFLGFSNPMLDQQQNKSPDPPSDFRRFLHVAGKSSRKGSAPLVEAWRRHPEWPPLDIVIDYPARLGTLPANVILWRNVTPLQMQALRNKCGIVLAPSEVEGFGHVLIEAMVHGALVVTTNAPPMNELITNDRGLLVDYATTGTFKMGRLFLTSPEAIESSVAAILSTPEDDLRKIANQGRAWVHQNHRAFHQRFYELCREAGHTTQDVKPETEPTASRISASEKTPGS